MKTLLFLLLLISSNAYSAIFTVNSVSDSIDINPGNGLCLDSLGHCSLRAAIMESNAFSGADTVYLQRSTSYTLSLLSGATDESFGDLDISDSVTLSIINPGIPVGSLDELPVINANGISRVLQIGFAFNVTVFAIVITGGDSSNEGANMGGGILVSTPSTINFNLLNSIVFANKAVQGAGIQTYASENLISFSDISFNLLLEANGNPTKGAAINNETGKMTIQNSSIHHNGVDFETSYCYEAVRNYNSIAGMFIFSSTIALNGTDLANNCITAVRGVESSLFLVNATIINNSGGGVVSTDSIGDKETFVRNSIIAHNNNVVNCWFLNNIGEINFGDVNGGNNITSDASCNMPNNSGNMQNTDPKLDIGRVLFPSSLPFFIYYEPLPESPAIDNGSPLAVNVGNPNACQQYDQILRTRPIDSDGDGFSTCDIGAVENNYDLIFKSGFE